MSLRTSDYEERVFHALSSTTEKLTVREIAETTKLKDSTVRRIVSVFEDMEFVEREPLYPEEAFSFRPSPAGKRLKKYMMLVDRAGVMQRLRLVDAEAHRAYARSR